MALSLVEHFQIHHMNKPDGFTVMFHMNNGDQFERAVYDVLTDGFVVEAERNGHFNKRFIPLASIAYWDVLP